MNDGAKAVGGLLAVILLVVVVGFLTVHKWESQKAQVQAWSKEHGYTLEGELQRPGLFEMSPFWFTDEDDDVWKTTLADRDHQKRTSWFRFRAWWGMDQAWKD